MSLRWPDPGPCPVDDAPHTTCCADSSGALVIPQLPCRDALADTMVPPAPPPPVPVVESFTTKTYRRPKR